MALAGNLLYNIFEGRHGLRQGNLKVTMCRRADNAYLSPAEWNRFKDLLQHDYTYSEIYVLYVAGSSDLAKRLPLKAREAYREAVEIKERYEKLHQELQTYGDKVLSMLVGRSHVTHQPRLCEGTIPTIAQLALSWAHPDGPRALTESYSALQQISASLGDIVAFWEYHVDDPVSTSSAAIWRRSQDALLAAMRTISASADTICVDAVGAPSKAHNGNKPVKSPSILRKLLGIFGLG